MTSDDPRLALLGDALRDAAAADLERVDEARSRPTRSADARVRRRDRARPRLGTRTAVALVAVVLAIPAAAIATGALSSEQEVAASIPQGTYAFVDTEPSCTTLREGQEYECVLGRAPNGEVPPGSGSFVIRPGQWNGVVEGTVDDTDHVNGGCRSQNADGTHWLCYLGEESVRQKILGAAALGQYAPAPAGP